MGRRRGKTLKALKKRAAAQAAAEEPSGDEEAPEVTSLSSGARKRQRREEQSKTAPRMTIKEALRLQKQEEAKAKETKVEEKAMRQEARRTDVGLEERSRYVGLDCEMVGTGANGKRSVLARACVVDWDGKILYDAFVQVGERVTDFRTQFSGVRPRDIKGGNAVTFAEAAAAVAALLKGKILVGHALRNDLKVLMLGHPRNATRDTATYRPFMRYVRGKFKPRKLKDLAKEHLAMTIQGGEHTPDEDAAAAMKLYRHKRSEWETALRVFKGDGSKAPKPVRQDLAAAAAADESSDSSGSESEED